RYQPNPLTKGLIAVHEAFGGTGPTFFTRLHDAVTEHHRALWQDHVRKLNDELLTRAPAPFTPVVLEELLDRATVADAGRAAALADWNRLRTQPPPAEAAHAGHHHGSRSAGPPPSLEPQPVLDALQTELTRRFAGWVLLRPKDRSDLIDSGGELDRVMQMPGWTNVWTRPIQNRVDMLSTGVNTAVGVRVLGRRLEGVGKASEEGGSAGRPTW